MFKSIKKFLQKDIKNIPCKAPLNNMLINQVGHVRICCNQKDIPLGIYPEKTLKDIWFGEKRKQIINEFINGIIPDICNRCINNNIYNISPDSKIQYSKQFTNSHFKQYPKQIEFLLSNNCNFSCIMCHWQSSSQKLTHLNLPENFLIKFDEIFLKEINVFLKKAKWVVFSGGEPFYIPIYRKIWDKINDINNKAKIYIQTNASIFNEEIEKFISRENVFIGVSIDSVHKELYEKIRVGADYNTVFRNIKLFDKAMKKKGKKLTVIITPMIINAFEIPSIFEYCYENNYRASISILEKPPHLAIWSLKSDEILEIYKYYKSQKEKIASLKNEDNELSVVYNYFTELLNVYYLQKVKCEKYKNEILDILKKTYIQNFDLLVREIYYLCLKKKKEKSFADNINKSLYKIFEMALQKNTENNNSWFRNYISTKISPEEIIDKFNDVNEKVFIEMGVTYIKEQLDIISSNSFFKLDEKYVSEFLNTI